MNLNWDNPFDPSQGRPDNPAVRVPRESRAPVPVYKHGLPRVALGFTIDC